jgi:hypothetical protein
MSNKERYDKYAAEFSGRFEELIRWAMENWPNKNFPLLQSDFVLCRKELADILGPKLSQDEDSALSPSPIDKDNPPFIETTPAPWP